MNLGSPRVFGAPVPPLLSPLPWGAGGFLCNLTPVAVTTRTAVPTHFLEATKPKDRSQSRSPVPGRAQDTAGRRRWPRPPQGSRAAESRPRGGGAVSPHSRRVHTSAKSTGCGSRGPAGARHRASGRGMRHFLKSEQTQTPSEQTRAKSPQGHPRGWFALQRRKATCRLNSLDLSECVGQTPLDSSPEWPGRGRQEGRVRKATS